MAHRDLVGDQPVAVLRQRCPTGEHQPSVRLQRAADVAECCHRFGEEHHSHARGRDVERGLLEGKQLRVTKQQRDVAQAALCDALPCDLEHRLRDVHRDNAPTLPHRPRQRQCHRGGAAADLQQVLAAGEAQTIQQQRKAFLVAPLLKTWAATQRGPATSFQYRRWASFASMAVPPADQ